MSTFLSIGYQVDGFEQPDVSVALRALLAAGNVAGGCPAVDARLAMFEAGSDIADGLIAHKGRWLGGEVLVSLDRKAVASIAEQVEQA